MAWRFNGGFLAKSFKRWVSPGVDCRVPCLIGASVAASTAITGATETQTAFDKKATIAPNVLEAGSVIRIRAQGIHTATTGSETHDMLLTIGSVTIASKTGINPADNDIFWFDQVVVVRDIGATGHIVAAGTMMFGASGGGTAAATALASTAIDTTAALDIQVQIDRQGTATDSDSARLDLLVVELV